MSQEKLKNIIGMLYSAEFGIELEVSGEAITMSVPQAHIAMVIGKEGRNAKAIRELVFLYNKLHHTDFKLEIVER
jgi:predicted RNA-binding protein YlqC (UPF0109 family)